MSLRIYTCQDFGLCTFCLCFEFYPKQPHGGCGDHHRVDENNTLVFNKKKYCPGACSSCPAWGHGVGGGRTDRELVGLVQPPGHDCPVDLRHDHAEHGSKRAHHRIESRHVGYVVDSEFSFRPFSGEYTLQNAAQTANPVVITCAVSKLVECITDAPRSPAHGVYEYAFFLNFPNALTMSLAAFPRTSSTEHHSLCFPCFSSSA